MLAENFINCQHSLLIDISEMNFALNDVLRNFIFSFSCRFNIKKSIFKLGQNSSFNFIVSISSNSTLNDNIFIEVQTNIFTFYVDCIHNITNIIFENKNKMSHSKMSIIVANTMESLDILNGSFLNLNLINGAQVLLLKLFIFI